jgi:hypothetical protein
VIGEIGSRSLHDLLAGEMGTSEGHLIHMRFGCRPGTDDGS